MLTYKEGSTRLALPSGLSDGDRAKLMGGTLSRVYGWSSSKARAPTLNPILARSAEVFE